MVVRIKINCGLGNDQCMLVKVYGTRECKIFFGFIAWIAKYLESVFQWGFFSKTYKLVSSWR